MISSIKCNSVFWFFGFFTKNHLIQKNKAKYVGVDDYYYTNGHNIEFLKLVKVCDHCEYLFIYFLMWLSKFVTFRYFDCRKKRERDWGVLQEWL